MQTQQLDVADAYNRALSTKLFTKLSPKSQDRDPEQIVPLVLARASAEKHLIEAERGDEDAFSTLVGVVEDGLAMVRQGMLPDRKPNALSDVFLSIEGRRSKIST